MTDTHEDRLVIDINDFIADLADRAASELGNAVEIEDYAVFPDDFYADRRTWKRVTDVVAVVADLKGSTALSYNRHPETTARIYEAATGNMVRVVERFEPDFVDIQGDGLFALYHGQRRFERAICSAITLKSFGISGLEAALAAHFGADAPETGIKVGVASGTVIVKKVGVRGTNEPVWPGRPINYATKAAQAADKQELIVTPDVWAKLENNAYVIYSCGCGSADGEATPLWNATTVEKLPEGAADCMKLPGLITWCSNHGDEFCQAILDGETKRANVSSVAA